MSFFGLKQGQDLEKPVVHPHQEFPGVPLPPPPPGTFTYMCFDLWKTKASTVNANSLATDDKSSFLIVAGR